MWRTRRVLDMLYRRIARLWRPWLPGKSQDLIVGWDRHVVFLELPGIDHGPICVHPDEARKAAAAFAACADLADGKPAHLAGRAFARQIQYSRN
jgi:hypothetical protein